MIPQGRIRAGFFPVPCSLFPIPYSLFPIPSSSLFPVPYSLFPIPYSLFPLLPCSLFPVPCSLFPNTTQTPTNDNLNPHWIKESDERAVILLLLQVLDFQ